MSKLKVAASILSFALWVLTPSEGVSQQRRQPPKPRKAPAPSVSVPTFDTLLGAGSYSVYVEVRGVGQLVRSNSINEVLEPIMKLSDPPKEFKTLVRWLNTRADDVMTSRMFVAAWPLEKNLPNALVAIEFSSAEEAAKFEPQLNAFLPKILPSTPQEVPPATNERNSEEKPPPKPNYYSQQAGSLILITPTPFKVQDLRPSKAKLFTEEPSFRVAKNRFASEQIFVYVDFEGIEKQSQNRRREYEEADAKRSEEEAKEVAKKRVSMDAEARKEKQAVEEEPPLEVPTTPDLVESVQAKPDEMTVTMESLAGVFFQGQGKMPDAMGFGIALEADSFEVRALMVTKPGEKCDPIPFFPNLIPGAPIVPESPSILPADTELFAAVSLDFPQIYAAMSRSNQNELDGRAEIKTVGASETVGPFAEIEKRLQIKIKDDLIPLLGSEVVVSLPLNFLDGGPIPKAVVAAPSNESKETDEKASAPSFIIALSLKDKEAMKALLPKIVDSIGFKGASAIGKTERHDNVELVSYANAFSYAFIENFLVFSPDPKATRHVVDSYLKHETLASDQQFKNYTRWQPRQLQGQLYISPVLMEGFKTWANQSNTLISEQMKEILGRLGLVAQPVTYSLSNDGLGTTHELHVPKNLVLMLITSMASESNPSPMIQNERSAMTALWMIANAQDQYRTDKGKGSFGTMEQLIAAELVSEEQLKNHGYKIELTIFGDRFEVTAVPDEYGKTGRTSYFVDQTHVLRAGDHGGGSATANDRPLGQ